MASPVIYSVILLSIISTSTQSASIYTLTGFSGFRDPAGVPGRDHPKKSLYEPFTADGVRSARTISGPPGRLSPGPGGSMNSGLSVTTKR